MWEKNTALSLFDIAKLLVKSIEGSNYGNFCVLSNCRIQNTEIYPSFNRHKFTDAVYVTAQNSLAEGFMKSNFRVGQQTSMGNQFPEGL